MSVEIQGSLVNFQVREPGDTPWLTLVCTEDSQFQITTEVSKRRTNCGIKTSVSDVDFNVSGNAVSNASPTSSEVSYMQLKAWIVAKTKLEFRYINDADVPAGITEGQGINNSGNLYFTDVTATASAEADGILSFSFTGEGTGTLDEFDES